MEKENKVLVGDMSSGYRYVDPKTALEIEESQARVRLAKEMLNEIYGMPKKEKKKEKENMNYYIDTDIAVTYAAYDHMYTRKTPRQKALDKIKNIMFNDPATIVFWSDGTKTVVKAKNEPYDPEKGLAMAIAKKFFDNKSYYFDVFKKWLPAEEKEEEIVDPRLGLTEEDKKMIAELVQKDKENAIPLADYCYLEGITKSQAMRRIHVGSVVAFKNEKGFWMVIRE